MHKAWTRRLAAVAAAGVTAFAMTGAWAAEAAADPRAADHAALRALRTKAVEAMNRADMAALSECFTENFVFTTADQVAITSRSQVQSYYDTMFKGADSPVTALQVAAEADALTVFTGPDSGYCHGKSADTYTTRRGGRRVLIPSRWTAVVVREKGQWKVAALHAGVNFADNPVIDIQTMSIWRRLAVGVGWSKLPGER